MVISTKHKYVFVELPRTGSSAISNELIQYYDGHKILNKHSTYEKYLRVASKEGKNYFVFSCIRNPLDRTVSYYFKFKNSEYYSEIYNKIVNSHKYTFKNIYFIKRYKFVRNSNCDFSDFFLKFYKLPYDDWSTLSHKKYDFIIRFENIENDFEKALKLIGICPLRKLPKKNITIGKNDNYTSYFNARAINRAKKVFSPFMKKWGYDFPSEWGNLEKIFIYNVGLFIINILKKLYWRHFK